ncbi:MAG: TlpA family protein disulfide reductase [Lachnospiraceae bacterium]|nr:TlpA family protein disulfide reductase [Lachnospiraceae bacterium]
MKKISVLIMISAMAVALSSCGSAESGRGAYSDDVKETVSEKDDKQEDVSGSGKEDETLTQEADTEEEYTPGDLVFDSVDINGTKVTDEIIKGSKLVLLNLWEPWCGPCVNEMPDLQKVYLKYKDKGLLIIGAYTTFDMDGEARSIVSSAGITYPIVKADENLYSYEQSYVPATFIFDGNGNLLDSNPVEGSRSYIEWDTLVSRYLSD